MSREDENVIFKTEYYDEEEIAECIACGKTDVDDLNDDTNHEIRGNGGVLMTRSGFEIFLCSYCRYIIEGDMYIIEDKNKDK